MNGNQAPKQQTFAPKIRQASMTDSQIKKQAAIVSEFVELLGERQFYGALVIKFHAGQVSHIDQNSGFNLDELQILIQEIHKNNVLLKSKA